MTRLRNTPTIQEIAEDPNRLKGLPLAMLAELTEEAKAAKSLADIVGKAISSEIENRFAEPIADAYKADGKDCGTVHIIAEGFDLTCDRAKRVDWNQEILSSAGDKIAETGDNPLEYLDRKLSVSESKFNAWPAHIRAVFEPARTVRPGPLTIKLCPLSSDGRRAA
jgi:hypothetical protein